MNDVPVIAIVDDDASVGRSLVRVVESAGYKGELFGSAREFLAWLPDNRASCLVLDVRMLGQSGLELQQVLEAAGHRIPVIFITGHADLPMAQQALRAGAVTLLAKPFDGEELLDAVRRAVETPRAAREAG